MGLESMSNAELNRRLAGLDAAFTALGDDPDYHADLVSRAAGATEAEKLRDLFQAVGAVLDQFRMWQ